MHRRLWLAVTMLVAGAGLLVAASLASASGNAHALKKGGIWQEGATGSSVKVDPQVAYITTAWWLEYATAAKLYNYPDRQGTAGTKLRPEVATNFRVSNAGKTYTFTIRKGFRFSDGKPVTAKSFKYAITRVLNKSLNSPGSDFIVDPNGTNIVGAQAVLSGKAKNVTGVIAKGNKLTIHLTKPDGTFMAKITMPFFQATSTKLPLSKEITGAYPSAGPYYYAANQVDRVTSLRQNKYWHKGPGRQRPRNLKGLDIRWGLNEQTGFNQVMAGQLDEGPLPAAEVQSVRKRFGINKSRYWVKPINCTGYLPLNTERGATKNVKLRKAINYALNRKAYIAQAGLDAGAPWTHILNPGVPGYRTTKPYPAKQNIAKARAMAGSLAANAKVTIFYRTGAAALDGQAQIVRQNLLQMGFKGGNINMKGFTGGDIYDAMGVRSTAANIGVSMGWCSDYPDPYDWMNLLLYGGNIKPENNVNYSYLNNRKFNKQLEHAAKLTGAKRLNTYGKLDISVMKKLAPVAAERTYTNRFILGTHVNTKSLVYQGIYQDWSIPALALK